MKSVFIALVFVISAHTLDGQNLVPNPSFEERRSCPVSYNLSSLNTVESWRQIANGTPDYFHSCSEKAGVPKNIFGKQPAKKGNAYAGLVTYASTKRDYREYLTASLERKLSAGEMVCIEVFISPADDSRFITDGLGVKLSKSKLKGNNDRVIEREATIEAPWLYLLDGYDQWTLLSQEYVAEGGEKFITIGNFKPDNRLNVLKKTIPGEIAANNWSYMYVDSVVVKPIKSKKECSCTIELLEEMVVDPPAELDETSSVEIESVHFDFDEVSIKTASKEKLDEVAKLLLKNKNVYIEINGHTDIVGHENYNKELSRKRAEAVRNYLEGKGIDAVRLKINFHGSQSPTADNSSSEGRAQNRRVEFGILMRSYELHSRTENPD